MNIKVTILIATALCMLVPTSGAADMNQEDSNLLFFAETSAYANCFFHANPTPHWNAYEEGFASAGGDVDAGGVYTATVSGTFIHGADAATNRDAWVSESGGAVVYAGYSAQVFSESKAYFLGVLMANSESFDIDAC